MPAGRGRGGSRPGAGRPRIDADASILQAARDALRDGGLQALSVDEVARSANVSAGTVYRRWPTKLALAVAAYSETIGPADPVDTGSLHGDLEEVAEDLYRFFSGEHGQILAVLVRAAGDEEAVEAAVRRSAEQRRAGLRRILERARNRGELDPATDLELLMDVLTGPLWARLLVTGRRITRPMVHDLISLTTAAVAG
jgi:AcrR family transcriptional regulator